MQFLENIEETGRELDSLRDREGKTHCLARSMIRILSQNDSLDRVERGRVKSIEDQLRRRVYGNGNATGFGHGLGLEKPAEIESIRLLKLPRKRFQPRLLH